MQISACVHALGNSGNSVNNKSLGVAIRQERFLKYLKTQNCNEIYELRARYNRTRIKR
jgi:hypothetical protein